MVLSTQNCLIEMSSLWHISRTAVAGGPERSWHARKLWCATQFSIKYTEFSSTLAYKLVDRMLALYPCCNDKVTIEWLDPFLDRMMKEGE